jgi:hypothetical protein
MGAEERSGKFQSKFCETQTRTTTFSTQLTRWIYQRSRAKRFAHDLKKKNANF